MVQHIKDMTKEEFKDLISTTVQKVLDEAIEDILALSSNEFTGSIEKAREDYKKGKTKNLDELTDV